MPPDAERRFESLLHDALDRREGLVRDERLGAWRAFHGAADGIDGLYLDRWGPGATLVRYDGMSEVHPEPRTGAEIALRALDAFGVRAVYDKPFVRDRSRGQGADDPVLTDPTPIAGEALPESLAIDEPSARFEVRLFDGFSTGLFLDQRATRAHLRSLCEREGLGRVANLFSYTGGFSVACALGGAETSTVDVSGRYLDWAKRNFTLNGLDAGGHHFARMDSRAFLDFAARKELLFDLIVLDPPTFGAANKARKVPAWSSTRDYPGLLERSARVLAPGGRIFASANTAALCESRAFDRLIKSTLGPGVRFDALPERQADFPEGDQYPVTRLVSLRR